MPSTTTERLSALDSTFLELEDADPCAHMHIGAVMVFGPRADGGVPSLAEVRTSLEARLDALPAYRRRLAGPGVGTITRQRWIPDEHFDIARHVVSATIPEPGGWDELLEWAGDHFSERMDRTKPLWHVVLVTGLADDHWALVTKTHHCLADGMGALEAARLFLDDVPAAPAEDEARPAGPLAPALGLVRDAVHLGTHPRDLVVRAAAVAEFVAREEVTGAPALSINDPIGPRRLLRAVTLGLDDARAIRRAFGGTVNDVVLAGVCGGLRALLRARGEELPPQGVRAMVPLNVRQEDGGSGNHISSLFVDLPVAEDDPQYRYEQITEATLRMKTGHLPLGADSLLALGERTPPLVHRSLSRAFAAKRLFNLTVTNVPGPPIEMTGFGAPLKAVWPLVPVATDHAVAVAVFSYAGQLMFGICVDRDGVPDVDVLADGIASGLDELCGAAGTILAV